MEVRQVKHMAFAVRSVERALADYARFLGVPADTRIADWKDSGLRVARFWLGGIEYQLCEPVKPDHPFVKWMAEKGEGLQHICYAVDDIDEALARAQGQGSTLRPCPTHKTLGSHAHSEGWVAFLDAAAGGCEIEFMKVYTPEQLAAWKAEQAARTAQPAKAG